jgi:4-hydroxybenzoate polyprenyltransferase
LRNTSYIRLFRPHQYIKNLFIFAPLLFSFDFSPQHIINTIIAFILFCLTASAVYILNDIHDIQEDRKHPTKKNRPLASGAITVKQAIAFMGTFAAIALIGSFLFNLSLFAILMAYILLNIAYSLISP